VLYLTELWYIGAIAIHGTAVKVSGLDSGSDRGQIFVHN